jgi:hypothetical protein
MEDIDYRERVDPATVPKADAYIPRLHYGSGGAAEIDSEVFDIGIAPIELMADGHFARRTKYHETIRARDFPDRGLGYRVLYGWHAQWIAEYFPNAADCLAGDRHSNSQALFKRRWIWTLILFSVNRFFRFSPFLERDYSLAH